MRLRLRVLQKKTHQGFTLLEVILAIAILAVSLAAIGEVVRMAFRNADGAADGLEARVLAQSVFAELQAGARELIDFGPQPMDGEVALNDWQVQVLIEPAVTEELVQVRVLVGRTLEPHEQPACELIRWFPNPDYVTSTTTGT